MIRFNAATTDSGAVQSLCFFLLAICALLPGCIGCRSATTLDAAKCIAATDGLTPCTDVIQRAIDQCSSSGGGIVRFPVGHYLIGTIQIKNNVTLHLDDGAMLLGSSTPADYQSIDPFQDATGRMRGEAMVVAVNASNIAIEGPGIIDGRGTQLMAAQKSSSKTSVRPFLIRLVGCQGVSMKHVQLRNSAAWTLHISQCRRVAIDHISIDSRPLPNNDGIDIDSSREVRVSNCDINTGDDSICIKTTSPLPCRDISVSGCTLQSRCSTFKVGTETVGDISNIKADHCRIKKAGLGGIKLFSVDGAQVENIEISDIEMDQARVPIMLRLGARLKTFRAGDAPRPVGVLRNVSIRNVIAENASEIGVLISGIPEHHVENVELQNIRITLPGGANSPSLATIPENESAYPEVYMFGSSLPAYGVYARHVRGLSIPGVNLILSNPDSRPAFELDDVNDRHFTAPPLH